jgi:hypothetical protein
MIVPNAPANTPADNPANPPADKPANTPAPGNADALGSIGAGLLDKAPEKSQHVIDKERDKAKVAAKRVRAAVNQTDKAGTKFDPAKHEVDDEGRPVLTARRTFKLRRGPGAPRGVVVPEEQGAEAGPTPDDIQRAVIEQRAEENAAHLVGAVIGLNCLLYADHGKPQKETETANMQDKAKKMLVKYDGGPDLPPWADFGLSVAAYTGKRALDKNARQEARGVKARIRGFFAAVKDMITGQESAQIEPEA